METQQILIILSVEDAEARAALREDDGEDDVGSASKITIAGYALNISGPRDASFRTDPSGFEGHSTAGRPKPQAEVFPLSNGGQSFGYRNKKKKLLQGSLRAA
ncbi:hypothetical protein KOW79_022511 [Hemibagrus wyckioides]|uniref:Uncharacterized protein n=1 Tax=Hemibagrus wyckioides TaxID=337641 RepID=A0A9D3S8A5_9TELE|nr:hypothetical protein KOW79_022511 [Hemibagrus wyckioides]